jgi:acyl-coenzyme A synthetase/AMP-(fatty) acid ligase
VYGPAEVNQCTFHHLDLAPGPTDAIPIGRAWSDTELRLVEPDGSTIDGPGRGELWVRSSTMMAGYWQRADLSEAAIRVETGPNGLITRWYRTGDLVDRDHTGLLTFVGRRDRQVKVRGVRIELEAVEAAIGALGGVIGVAAVTAATDDDAELVALVEVAPSAEGIDAAAIIGHARSTLPPGAVPTRVEIVSALPRTTSGKIDAASAASSTARADHRGGIE